MKFKFELNDEQVDEIILKELEWHYKNAKKNVKRLREKNREFGLEKFEEEDFNDNKRLKKALKEVLKYYGSEIF